MGKCYWVISASFSFLFFALPFVHIPFFTFAPMPCCLLCCICSCCWLSRVNGKRSCLCWVSWFNKKKEEALYVFGHAFFGFFERLVWLLWGGFCGLGPLGEGTFCIFGLGKGSEFWRAGPVVLFVFVMLLFFLFYLICLYWIVLKNNKCYCPL